jgi:hypothetical protein
MGELRGDLEKGKQQVTFTMNSLTAVASTTRGDLREVYTKFVKDVGTLKAQAKAVRTRAADMRERKDAYVKAWHESLETVANPEIRTLAEERRKKVEGFFQKIRDAYGPLKDSYEPFEADLTGITKYLDNDLTPAGITSLAPVIAKAGESSKVVIERASALIAEIDSATKALSPMLTPPPVEASGGEVRQ